MDRVDPKVGQISMRGEPAHAPRNSRGVRRERFNCRAKSDSLTIDSLTIVVKSRTGAPYLGWWASEPENESRHFIGKNEVGLCKSSKSATLCYTVSHLLFRRRKNRNREQAVKSITSTKRRDGGTGRRSGLKIRRPSGLGGSTPLPAPFQKPIKYAATWARSPHAMNLCSRRSGLCTNI